MVNSLITSHGDGADVKAAGVIITASPGTAATASARSRFRSMAGHTGRGAKLGADLGRFAFRPWSFDFAPRAATTCVTVRATNAIGQTQIAELILNPAGYHNNVIQTLTLNAA